MADVESTPPSEPRRKRSRRIWFPIGVLALSAVGLVALQLFFLERLDSGTRLMLTFVISAIAFASVAAWFFFMSDASGRARVVGATVLGAAVLFVLLAVRRVEFSGDMIPTFDFRWTPDRMALLEEHRTRQRDEIAAAPADLDGLLPPITTAVGSYDVLEYRGPHRDGIVPGPALARDWSREPPRPIWRQPVGGGYASFVVVGPTLVTIEQRRQNEAIVAYDADSGHERWVYEYPALFSETLGGDGPRATPAFHDGKLYALGATGQLTCVSFINGTLLWSVNILEDNRSENLDWGMSGSPLVHDDVVLVNPGNQKGGATSRSIAAYDLENGELRWSEGESRASYASPVLVTLGGVRQLLIFDAVGLAGHDPTDGRELWRFPWKSAFDINASQPVVVDDQSVLISSTSGTALLRVVPEEDRWLVEQVWRQTRMKCGYSNPIAYRGHLYGLNEGILTCIALEDGQVRWKDRGGQFGHGQMLLRDDLLLVLGEAGELALVEATPEAFRELGRIQAIEGKTWNVPVLVDNRIFVRNHLEMAAYDLPIEP